MVLALRPDDPARREDERKIENPGATETFDSLHPGGWHLTALLLAEQQMSLFDLGEVELQSGRSETVDARLEPNVFHGTVTDHGSGVAAKILVHVAGMHPSTTSGDDGRYRLVLQGKGFFDVAVARLDAQTDAIPIGKVNFTDPYRPVDITIPGRGRVTVRVRRGGDPPEGRTVVNATRRDESGLVDMVATQGRFTDPSGIAVFSDLAPGRWTFSVHDSSTQAESEKSVTVRADEEQTVQLELSDSDRIEGVVYAVDGSPLPRSTIDCLWIGAAGNPDRKAASSDWQGEFSINLAPPAPASALCGVIGADGTVGAARVIPGQHLSLTEPAVTGTLLLRGWSSGGNPDLLWLVAPDGRAVSVSAIAASLHTFGPDLTIPAMAAGRWSLVRLRGAGDWPTLATGFGAALRSDATVEIEPGEARTLQVPPG